MANPRITRLQTDYGKVKKLIDESGGSLKLVRTAGSPPTTYVVEYNCPSLVENSLGTLTIRHQHRVEINLDANYPLGKPSARMLSPVFNPHVFPNLAICLGGVWNASETLDMVILKIGALLQLDPRVLDPNSPANQKANQWIQQNRSKIPLGQVSFQAPIKPSSKIVWH
jgi:ubiquitin-protein ligase